MTGARDVRRILVVTPTWVGDIVMAQTVFMTLAERFPEASIDALAPDWAGPLLSRMPQVRECIALPMGHGELRLGAQFRLARKLAGTGYDLAIVTRRAAKAALIPWMAGIPTRVGARGEFRPFTLTEQRSINSQSHPSNVARLSALAAERPENVTFESAPWPALVGDRSAGRTLVEGAFGTAPLPPSGRIVGLAPGAAFGPAKRWPWESWRILAEALVERGDGVVVLGSPSEAEASEAIVTGLRGTANLCGRTTLGEVVDVMSACDVVVSNDSGLMHVAAAVDTWVVALFGSTSPINTPPLSKRATSVWLELECSPCYARECPLGHLRCLRELTPARVLEAVDGGEA